MLITRRVHWWGLAYGIDESEDTVDSFRFWSVSSQLERSLDASASDDDSQPRLLAISVDRLLHKFALISHAIDSEFNNNEYNSGNRFENRLEFKLSLSDTFAFRAFSARFR